MTKPPSEAPPPVSGWRQERAALYQRLARAEARARTMESELDFYRDEHRRELARATAALERAEAAEAAPAGPKDGGPATLTPVATLERAAARADERVAAAADRSRARRGGTQTLGPFVPSVPLPGGPVARPKLRVACVLDQFSRLAFQYEFDAVQVPLPGWQQFLGEQPPDLVLVESAWQANGGQWRHRLSRTDRPHADVIELVQWARRRGIPTVFWNKEDPPNFDRFKHTATVFDHVFTTEARCIPRYLEMLDHGRVDVLPFAAQPRIHNPLRVPGTRERSVAFAGTYYADKHPDRKVQMETLLDPARAFGLEIFSRVSDDPRYTYPEKYAPHIVGTLPYPDVLTAHKLYRVFLNVNSVVDSETMCARRIFELLAAGTSVLSGVSPAIVNQLGPGLVTEASGPEQTRAALAQFLDHDTDRAQGAVRGLRRILQNHTYGDRTDTILRAVGLTEHLSEAPTVTVVARVERPEDLESLLANVHRQSRPPDAVVVIPAAPGLEAPGVRVLEAVEGETVGAGLRRAFETAMSRYVAVFDPHAAYATDYLGDALAAFRYADADIVGKREEQELEYRPVGWLDDASLVFRREVLERARPGDLDEGALLRFQLDCLAAGASLLATDRFNFARPGEGGGEADSTA